MPLLCFHFAVAILKYAIWAPTWWTQLGLAAAITAYCWQAPRINIVIAIALVYVELWVQLLTAKVCLQVKCMMMMSSTERW